MSTKNINNLKTLSHKNSKFDSCKPGRTENAKQDHYSSRQLKLMLLRSDTASPIFTLCRLCTRAFYKHIFNKACSLAETLNTKQLRRDTTIQTMGFLIYVLERIFYVTFATTLFVILANVDITVQLIIASFKTCYNIVFLLLRLYCRVFIVAQNI